MRQPGFRTARPPRSKCLPPHTRGAGFDRVPAAWFPHPVASDLEPVRLVVLVSGRVQGVGFRDWTRRQAVGLGLAGRVRNLPDGRVEVVAEGSRPACERLLTALSGPQAPGRVGDVTHEWASSEGATSFRVS
jgi:acylphosphatase